MARAIDGIGFLADLLTAASGSDEIAEPYARRGYPVGHLFGCDLPAVYETHWRRKAGISRDVVTGDVGGPYVRFAQAVAGEMGVKASAETVAAAFKEAKRNLSGA